MSDTPETTPELTIDTDLEPTALELAGDAPVYVVCGTKVKASGFSYYEYAAWRDFAKAKKLETIQSKMLKASSDAGQELRGKAAYEGQEKLIKALQRAIEMKLADLTRDPLAWTAEDEQYLTDVAQKIDEARDKLHTMEPDAEAMISTSTRHMEGIDELRHQERLVYLEFVHTIVTRRKTKSEKVPSFTTWRDSAGGQDLVNANAVVNLGKAPYGIGAQPKQQYKPKTKYQLS